MKHIKVLLISVFIVSLLSVGVFAGAEKPGGVWDRPESVDPEPVLAADKEDPNNDDVGRDITPFGAEVPDGVWE